MSGIVGGINLRSSGLVNISSATDGQVFTGTGAGLPVGFEAPAGGGDLRNFIIDGDMTQFPEANITAIANSAYGSALWENFHTGGELVHDVDQLADVPTVGESDHSSTYCMSIDITTAESAVASGDFQVIEYKVTGSDFAYLNQQQVTLSFWHKHTKTGTFCGYFMNSAEDRSYVYEYTQSSTNTWEKHTETLTLDTSGTWLLTDADIGLRVGFCMYGGSTFQGTADSWEGAKDYCTSSQVTGADNAANFCKFSQVGLYLGSSAPDSFLSNSISTVINQVEWYIQRYTATGTNGDIAVLAVNTTAQMQGPFDFRREMRATPNVTFSSYNTFRGHDGASDTLLTGLAVSDRSTLKCTFKAADSGGTWDDQTAGRLTRDGTDTCFIQADARH